MLEPFSQRVGLVKKTEFLQKDNADELLKTDLWNVWYTACWHHENRDNYLAVDDSYLDFIWTQLLHGELNVLHNGGYGHALHVIHEAWFKGSWHFCYDVIDATLVYRADSPSRGRLADQVDDVLQSDLSAYRIIAGALSPITTDLEISTVETALATTDDAVQEHLGKAITHLSDRENPDYRNSIKESISAVESVCKRVAGRDKATLGDALKELKNAGVIIHPALEKAFGELYGYTSDKPGIRHALLGVDDLSQEDAIYFVVTCSAFVNYLIVKANKAGIQL